MSKSTINILKRHVQWLFQIITWIIYRFSISINFLEILVFPITFCRIIKNCNKWNTYAKYKYAIGNNKNSMQFILNTFSRQTTDTILSMVLYKYPDCFSKYVIVEGEDYVKEFQRTNKGVLVIGNHGGPLMLQTYLFSKVFNIPLSSYSAPWLKSETYLSKEINQLVQQSPVYFTGEEKKFLKALLSGEWINILLDVDVNEHQSPNCTFANHPIQLSQFPFRISLKYNIPILYLEIKRGGNGDKIQINIRPINKFSKPEDGLNKYVQFLESTIFSDYYSNKLMPFVLQKVYKTTV